MEKKCKTCAWWEKDYGMFTATGWTGSDRKDGKCVYERISIPKQEDSRCSKWEEG